MGEWDCQSPFLDLPPFTLSSFDLGHSEGSYQPYEHTQEFPTLPPGQLCFDQSPMDMSSMGSTLDRYVDSRDDPYFFGLGRYPYSNTRVTHIDIAACAMHDGHQRDRMPIMRQIAVSPIGTSSSWSSYSGTSATASRGNHYNDFDAYSIPSSISSGNAAYDESYGSTLECHHSYNVPGYSLREIQRQADASCEHSIPISYGPMLHSSMTVIKHVHSFGSSSYPEELDEIRLQEIHEDDTEEHEGHSRDNSPAADDKNDTSDSDYRPVVHSPSRKRRHEDTNKGDYESVPRKRSSVGRRRQSRRNERSSLTQSNMTLGSSRQSPGARDFPCLLRPYGCDATFTSKNEWKRHISTQHLCLRVWRCDLCPEAASRPNEFNRKDLFAQHLKRMHSPQYPKYNEADKIDNKTEQMIDKQEPSCTNHSADAESGLDGIFERCLVQIREPPPKLCCTFCDATFRCHGTCEEWLEHVGRHLMLLAKGGPAESKIKAEYDEVELREDVLFRDWLVKQKVLEFGIRRDSLVLVDKVHGRARECVSKQTSEEDDAAGDEE